MKYRENYENLNDYKTAKGQISLLPSVNTEITQGPGYCKDGTKFNRGDSANYAYSHQFYRAVDLHTENKQLRAPFDCRCVHFSYEGFTSVKAAVFQSIEKVITPSNPNNPCYVSFMVQHGGDSIDTDKGKLKVGLDFKQGQVIYTEGTQGEVAEHIHINVILRQWTSISQDLGYVTMDGYDKYGNPYELKDVGYLKNDCNIEDAFYAEQGETVSFDADAKLWEGHINFNTYTGKLEWNGWIADGSEWYYYKNGVKASGWLKTSDGTFYLDPNNGNAMLTGWFKEGGSNYYFNPKAGEAGHQEKYVGGVMLTGWQWIDEHWYLFGEGGVMQTGWVWSAAWEGWYYLYTSGAEAGQMAKATWIEDIYYVLSDGKMAKNCQIRYNGKYYAFNNSGACLNTSGQTTQYNTTTYPMKS